MTCTVTEVPIRHGRQNKVSSWIPFRKVWVSIKFLSAKFGFPPPPPKRAQNEEKLLQISIKSSKLALFPGGGDAILWTKRFYGHLGVSEPCPSVQPSPRQSKSKNVQSASCFAKIGQFSAFRLFSLGKKSGKLTKSVIFTKTRALRRNFSESNSPCLPGKTPCIQISTLSSRTDSQIGHSLVWFAWATSLVFCFIGISLLGFLSVLSCFFLLTTTTCL